MHPTFKKIPAIAIVCALAGCQTPVVEKDAPMLTDEVVFVIGVSPENVSVELREAELIDDTVKTSMPVFGLFKKKPENGYIVGKLKADHPLAVATMQFQNFLGSGPIVAPCSGSPTLTFTPQAGKVVYLGDINIKFIEPVTAVNNQGVIEIKVGAGGARWNVVNKFAAAQEYMNTAYPKWAPKLESQPFSVHKARWSCSQK